MSKAAKGCFAGIAGLLFWLFTGPLGCVGVLIGLGLLVFLIWATIKAVVLVSILIRVLLLIGALYGVFITLRNYCLALVHNIKPERVTP